MEEYVVGIICCIISVICFGSMFVPLQFVETKDGFFVQWVQCATGLCEGLIVLAVVGFPKVEPLAMIGGIIWATGNITAIPIVNSIGMGLGMLIWTSLQILAGWATARFGWFGLKSEIPENNAMSIGGVVLSVVSGLMFAAVSRSSPGDLEKKKIIENVSKKSSYATPPDTPPLTPRSRYESLESLTKIPWQASFDEYTPLMKRKQSAVETAKSKITSHRQKIIAVLLSIFAGLLYGEMITPITYLQEQGSTKSGLAFTFSFMCGVFGASSVYFLLYCIFMKNKPFINPQSVLPGVLYGILWSVAMTAWFLANGKLQHSVAYPINSRLPSIVATIWSVIYLREIRGLQNFVILISAVCVAAVGVILIGLGT